MPVFASPLKKLPEYQAASRCVGAGRRPVVLSGLGPAEKAHCIAALCEEHGRPAVVLASDEAEAAQLQEDLSFFLGDGVFLLPAREMNFYEVESFSRETEAERLRVLGKMHAGEAKAVLLAPAAAMQMTLPPEDYAAACFTLQEGETCDLDALSRRLLRAGYTRVESVESLGQFARRGAIVDIFAPAGAQPVRMELWGDEIDTISFFDTETQRRGERAQSVRITPAREVLPDADFPEKLEAEARAVQGNAPLVGRLLADAARLRDTGTLPWCHRYMPLLYREATPLDYAGEALLFVSEYHKTVQRAEQYEQSFWEDYQIFAESGHVLTGERRYIRTHGELDARVQQAGILLEAFARTSYPMPLAEYAAIPAMQLPVWNGDMQELTEALAPVREGSAAVVLTGTARAARTVASDLVAAGFTAVSGEAPETLEPRRVYVSAGRLSSGFTYPPAGFLLLSHARPDEQRRRTRRGRPVGQKIGSLDEISVGDAVVHAVHGIGIYEGIHKIEVQGVVKDYLKIRYAGTDVLYVPVTQLDLVTKYIGQEAAGVRLSKMGGTDWARAKSRVRHAVRDMAKELIALYSKRMAKKGHAFPPDGEWQRDFEERFEYTETQDQLTAAEEIKRDMESTAPMERLLCGDVGFGKTEVALRAAFKCVADGKQCAILVPTTILAWQHYQTLVRRMEGFPVQMGLLCRFRTPAQQRETLRKLARGEIDIVVGTHRLVQKDVRFHDLGLLIIDEEQRFGVAQKEYLKEKFDTVDCLSLSATPIPRTLNMALSGIRDMSSIEEAPGGRRPVQTYVVEYDEGMLLETIRRELRRGGQVYYLHNYVDTIDRKAYQLSRELPDARIAVAHGKMSEQALSEVWEKLVNREIDVLVCTTIIETGVDVPNANTLIIENADHMGLSQLHQLRGRIGRSYRTAYAYFTFKRGKVMSEVAEKRLGAIKEFTEFGSGIKIAMRDLEIRGAGNVLGGEQHGHMDAVGYDMYLKLLSEAIDEERGVKKEEATECTVDIPVTAHIPESYIGEGQRIEIYRRIAAVQNYEQAGELVDELVDRFGEPPAAVQALIDVAVCRNRAAAVGIEEIGERGGMLLFYPRRLSPAVSAALVRQFGRRARVNAGTRPYYALQYPRAALLPTIEEFLDCAEAVQREETQQADGAKEREKKA